MLTGRSPEETVSHSEAKASRQVCAAVYGWRQGQVLM